MSEPYLFDFKLRLDVPPQDIATVSEALRVIAATWPGGSVAGVFIESHEIEHPVGQCFRCGSLVGRSGHHSRR